MRKFFLVLSIVVLIILLSAGIYQKFNKEGKSKESPIKREVSYIMGKNKIIIFN